MEALYCLLVLAFVTTFITITATQPCTMESSNTCSASSSQIPVTNKKHHFVLIHGAGHGAWSWYKVAALLKASGHNVTALDLGASGINPIQVQQLPSFSEYVQPLTELMVDLPVEERVVMVSHSMTGATVAVIMEKFPEKIGASVYVTSFMSGPSLSYSTIFAEINKRLDYMDSEYRFDNDKDNSPTSFRLGPKVLAASFYQLSPPEDLTLGMSLVRFSPLYNYDVMKLTEEKFGSVPRVYIVAEQDQAILLEVQNFMIKNNPPEEVRVIGGSDHMVMLSRPVELFSHLVSIGEKYS